MAELKLVELGTLVEWNLWIDGIISGDTATPTAPIWLAAVIAAAAGLLLYLLVY